MNAASRRLRIGVVGVNPRIRRAILKGLAASPRAVITGICSRSAEKAAEAACDLGTAKAYTDYGQMVRADTVDAVFICTPPEIHHPMAMLAIQAGKPVACEKPLAVSVAQAREIEHEARAAGVRTAVNFTYRSGSPHRFLAHLLGSGEIGRLLHFELGYWQARQLFPATPRKDALADLGPHAVDLLRWWLGRAGGEEVSEVSGLESPFSEGGTPVNGTCQCLLKLRSGAAGVMCVSRVAVGYANGITAQFCGDLGALALRFDVDRATVLRARLNEGRPEGSWTEVAIPPEWAVSYDEFPGFHMDRIVGALLGEEDFPGFAEGLAAQEIIEAAGRSAAERRWVTLPLSE